VGLPEGEEIMTLAFFVLTQYRRVTDRQTEGQTERQTDSLQSQRPARVKTILTKMQAKIYQLLDTLSVEF